jgi:hypothetical protein
LSLMDCMPARYASRVSWSALHHLACVCVCVCVCVGLCVCVPLGLHGPDMLGSSPSRRMHALHRILKSHTHIHTYTHTHQMQPVPRTAARSRVAQARFLPRSNQAHPSQTHPPIHACMHA